MIMSSGNTREGSTVFLLFLPPYPFFPPTSRASVRLGTQKRSLPQESDFLSDISSTWAVRTCLIKAIPAVGTSRAWLPLLVTNWFLDVHMFVQSDVLGMQCRTLGKQD